MLQKSNMLILDEVLHCLVQCIYDKIIVKLYQTGTIDFFSLHFSSNFQDVFSSKIFNACLCFLSFTTQCFSGTEAITIQCMKSVSKERSIKGEQDDSYVKNTREGPDSQPLYPVYVYSILTAERIQICAEYFKLLWKKKRLLWKNISNRSQIAAYFLHLIRCMYS